MPKMNLLLSLFIFVVESAQASKVKGTKYKRVFWYTEKPKGVLHDTSNDMGLIFQK